MERENGDVRWRGGWKEGMCEEWMGSRGGGVERGDEWRQRGWWREVTHGEGGW